MNVRPEMHVGKKDEYILRVVFAPSPSTSERVYGASNTCSYKIEGRGSKHNSGFFTTPCFKSQIKVLLILKIRGVVVSA
jgi:hypothetical protein